MRNLLVAARLVLTRCVAWGASAARGGRVLLTDAKPTYWNI